MNDNEIDISYKEDILKRNKIAENILTLLSTNNSRLSPMVLDCMGSGKSVFCNHLIQLLKEKKESKSEDKFQQLEVIY